MRHFHPPPTGAPRGWGVDDPDSTTAERPSRRSRLPRARIPLAAGVLQYDAYSGAAYRIDRLSSTLSANRRHLDNSAREVGALGWPAARRRSHLRGTWFRGGSSANLRVVILHDEPSLFAETQCVSVPGTRTANSRPYHDNFRGQHEDNRLLRGTAPRLRLL